MDVELNVSLKNILLLFTHGRKKRKIIYFPFNYFEHGITIIKKMVKNWLVNPQPEYRERYIKKRKRMRNQNDFSNIRLQNAVYSQFDE